MPVECSFDHVCIEKEELESLEEKLDHQTMRMKEALKQGYDDDHASLSLLDDGASQQNIVGLIEKKKLLHPQCIVVVGIGGSNLGTVAIQEALLGSLYNQKGSSPRILYADTVDEDKITDIAEIMETMLVSGQEILINAVSKSGGTTETMANFQVLLEILRNHREEYSKYVVVTTDHASKFWHLARDLGFDVLEIPKKVGGRFSVFSPVGLFPLGMLGLDIGLLIEGAREMRDACLDSSIWQNPAAMSAAVLYLKNQKGINIHDTFLFNTDLESVGKWYRQLMGESIGKQFDLEGSEVFCGMTPTVSIGSTDLHSMAQLYLGGPYDKITTFVDVQENRSSSSVPIDTQYAHLVEDIQGGSLRHIMQAIYEGTKAAFLKKNRPFMEIVLSQKDEKTIAALLQMKMMEMMYLGNLMDVNTFDQPNVEEYKVETKRVLSQQ